MGRSVFLGVSHALLQGCGVPELPNFVDSLLFTHTPFRCRTTKFDVVTHVGRGLVFRGQPRPHTKGRGSSAPQLLGFPSIYEYTLCCRTTKFYMVTLQGRTSGGGAFILRSATPHIAPCGLRGCKNGPAPFPGRMSYKATKPGLVFVLYLSMFIIVFGVY